VALYQTGVFASAFIGPIVGGFLADNVGFELIFGLSGLGRLMGMVIFVAMTAWPLHKLRKAAAAA
jgi:dipeptide/tripeptide permease